MRVYLTYFSLLVLPLVCVGCGKNPGQPVAVSGSVTLDGKPIGNVIVGFSAMGDALPMNLRYAHGKTDAQGNFKIEKVYPAEYIVSLTDGAEEVVDPSKPHDVTKRSPKLAAYVNDSPLRAKVSKDAASFKFEAKSDYRPRRW